MSSHPTATLRTAKGDILIELFEDAAPRTVENFLELAEDGFYDGVRFHRVVPDFVVQGGCPHSRVPGDPRAGTGGPGYTIPCELEGNPHKHEPGSLSMAHRGRDTGGSQFFICLGSQPHLDGEHTVFGKVVDGMDVVKKIEAWDEIEGVEA